MELQRVNGIRGVLDNEGRIHLIWIGPEQQFLYSSAHADVASSAQAWQPQLILAHEQTGIQYSADIAFEPPQTIHVVYGRAQSETNQTIMYIRSVNGGLTWSAPSEIYALAHPEYGPSNIRLLIDTPKVYMTWTEWDVTGNGQAIYFARSLDSGVTWQQPVLLAKRAEEDYERDWTSLALLGEDQLIALWEGGYRAYPQAQYSDDGGSTWSEPIDTFPWLIADNGFAEFARDSTGRLHVFLARRIREGYGDKCSTFRGCSDPANAIWHSIWESGRKWQEPQPLEFTFSPLNFISIAISGGNRLVAAWFSYTESEVHVMQCEIDDAPAVGPKLRPTPIPTPTIMPTATSTSFPVVLRPTAQLPLQEDNPSPTVAQFNGSNMLLSMSVPALAILAVVVLVHRRKRRQ
jgi:hypothetical protein